MRERDFALVSRGELYGGVVFTKFHIPVSKPNEINTHTQVWLKKRGVWTEEGH